MKKLCSVLLTFVIVMGMVIPAFAAVTEPVTIEISEENGAAAIVNALYLAGEQASEATPYEIYVAAGRYELDRGLHIFSNTALILDENAVIVDCAAQGDNMIKVGTTGDDPASGYYYKNISVQGGQWDGNGKVATMFKFVHARNCTLSGVKAFNLKDAHFIEIAGVDGMQVLSCDFSEHIITTNNGTEAIQIDVLQKDHIAGYVHLDDEIDYLCKNIVIDGCTFNGMRRAIGSHTAVLGKYYENIQITNNRFIHSSEKSILCFNMKDLLIEGNSIAGDNVGIEIKTMDRNGAGSYLLTNNKDGIYVKPTDLNVTIRANRVSSNTDHAIFVSGFMIANDIAAKERNNDKVPKGNYYVQGVSIQNNTLCAYGNKCGIKVQFAKDTVINNNTITAASTAQTPIYVSDGCNGVSITNNKILSAVLNGIRVCNLNTGYPRASIAAITGNTIASVLKDGYGIRVSDAAVGNIMNNIITKSANIGIQADVNPNVGYAVSVKRINTNIIKSARIAIKLMKASASEIILNTLYPTTESALMILDKCVVGTVSKNVIAKAGDSAILVRGSKVTAISSNTITSPKRQGIYVYEGYGTDTINANKISGAGENGICANGVTIKTIYNNVIASCKSFGIYINGNNTSTNIGAIKGNRLNACTNPIKILKGSKVHLYVNAAASNRAANKYVINGSKQYTLGNVASVSLAAKKAGKTICLNWAKKSTVSGYMIYRSAKSTGGFVKIGTASANAKLYTDKSAKAKVVYYYRILPYYKVAGSNVVLYGNVTQSKAVKR